jgi:hypothetical protein
MKHKLCVILQNKRFKFKKVAPTLKENKRTTPMTNLKIHSFNNPHSTVSKLFFSLTACQIEGL